jgi:hypothetical protein
MTGRMQSRCWRRSVARSRDLRAERGLGAQPQQPRYGNQQPCVAATNVAYANGTVYLESGDTIFSTSPTLVGLNTVHVNRQAPTGIAVMPAPTTTAVPEPASLGLLGVALARPLASTPTVSDYGATKAVNVTHAPASGPCRGKLRRILSRAIHRRRKPGRPRPSRKGLPEPRIHVPTAFMSLPLLPVPR